MKRALLVTAGTVVGVAAALSYVPRPMTDGLTTASADGLGALDSSTDDGPFTKDSPDLAAKARKAHKKKAAANKSATADPGATLPDAGPAPAANDTQSLPSLPSAPTPKKTTTPKRPTTKPKPVAAAPKPKPVTATASKTYQGAVAATPFGPMQVAIMVKAGRITDAAAIQYPKRDPKSVQLAAKAIPKLRQETLATQSANVSSVSGASYTSSGWKKSLQSAITQAGL